MDRRITRYPDQRYPQSKRRSAGISSPRGGSWAGKQVCNRYVRRVDPATRMNLEISRDAFKTDLLRFNVHPPVDEGPFYLRFMVDAVCEITKERGHGIAELVKPDRIHIAPFQPFVRMRVHQVDGPNSFLLPLFTGAGGDKVKRFFSHLKRL